MPRLRYEVVNHLDALQLICRPTDGSSSRPGRFNRVRLECAGAVPSGLGTVSSHHKQQNAEASDDQQDAGRLRNLHQILDPA